MSDSFDATARESYIVNRYRLWTQWSGRRYEYKHHKGARIAQILRETGGLPAFAVEVGVGPAGVATEVSRQGVKVIGFDLSPDALLHAKAHSQGANVALMRASGFALPFADHSVPVVYASQVLHLFNADGRLALMKEIHRVLVPGGRFVFDMKNRVSHLYRYLTSSPERKQRNFPPQAELLTLLRQAGYASITTRPGLLPLAPTQTRVPDNVLCRTLAHTTFFVATR